MAASTVDISNKTLFSPGPYYRGLMAAEAIPYGVMVMINAAGYVANATDTAGTAYYGVTMEAVDNSGGSAGDLRILVDIGGPIVRAAHATGSLAAANVNDEVNMELNNEFDDATSTNDIRAGRILEVLSAADIWVKTQAYDGAS